MLDMLPSATIDGEVSSVVIDVEPIGNGLIGPPNLTAKSSHLNNGRSGEFAVLNRFTNRHSPLGNGVTDVFRCRANPQMLGIHTGAIVTTGTIVKHIHAVWNKAIMKLPRKPMCENRSASAVKLAVSSTVFASVPEPASIGLNRVRLMEKVYGVRGDGHASMMQKSSQMGSR